MATIQKRERGWKGLSGKNHPRSKAVCATNIVTGESTKFESANQCAIQLGLHQPNVTAVLKGRLNKTGGYKIQYEHL